MQQHVQTRTATLYRMVMPEHTCPFGLKSKDLLERQGFSVDDHHLKTRQETDAFMKEHGVETTPQTFIAGERIGGYDDLRIHFGIDPPKEAASPAKAARKSGKSGSAQELGGNLGNLLNPLALCGSAHRLP